MFGTGARRLYAAREEAMTGDYRSRIMPADVALAELRSGQRVYVHNGCAEPVELVKALTRRGPELEDVEVLHMATMGIADYILPEYEGHFRHNALFIGGNVRKAVQEGRADYTPIFLSEIEELFTSKAIEIDVCLLQCTPPDAYGYMSLGTSIDASLTAAQCARHVIVEINDQCPRTLGDYPRSPGNDLPPAIRSHVARLIPDGATIHPGIGGIPEDTLGLLRDCKD